MCIRDSAKNSLSGSVMGRPINAFTLGKGASVAPPPGEYDLLPPVTDPVFGSYIIAVRQGSSFKPGYDWRKLTADPGAAARWDTFKLPAARMIWWTMPAGTADKVGFVLSKQPIPGLNCIVLAAGFSDLLDALSSATDATLTVS